MKILPIMTIMRIRYEKTSSKIRGKLSKKTSIENNRIRSPATENDMTKKQFHRVGLSVMICLSKRILFTVVYSSSFSKKATTANDENLSRNSTTDMPSSLMS